MPPRSFPAPAAVAGPSTPQRQPARPVRPVCRYYATPAGCFQGNNCKFRHSEEETVTPHQQAQKCRYFATGFCKRGANCWYKHVGEGQASVQQLREVGSSQMAGTSSQTQTGSAMGQPTETAEEEEYACMICYETPAQYALLVGCSHIFCLTCMRGWRDSKDKDLSMVESGVIKSCPVCRVDSRFVTPSSQFYPHGHPKKVEMMNAYKASMARVPCRYFTQSITNSSNPFCPYGRNCFYEHKLANGELFVFPHGAEYYMTMHRDRVARRRREEAARGFEALADVMFNSGLEGGEIFRRDMAAAGFWPDVIRMLGVDAGTIPQDDADGQLIQLRRLMNGMMDEIRRDGPNPEDDEEDLEMPRLVTYTGGANARRPPVNPRVPPPHPRVVAPNGNTSPDDDDDDMPTLLSITDSEESEDEGNLAPGRSRGPTGNAAAPARNLRDRPQQDEIRSLFGRDGSLRLRDALRDGSIGGARNPLRGMGNPLLAPGPRVRVLVQEPVPARVDTPDEEEDMPAPLNDSASSDTEETDEESDEESEEEDDRDDEEEIPDLIQFPRTRPRSAPDRSRTVHLNRSPGAPIITPSHVNVPDPTPQADAAPNGAGVIRPSASNERLINGNGLSSSDQGTEPAPVRTVSSSSTGPTTTAFPAPPVPPTLPTAGASSTHTEPNMSRASRFIAGLFRRDPGDWRSG